MNNYLIMKSDKIKSEMGATCSMHKRKNIHTILVENPKGRIPLGIDGKVIFERI
jgi:hypothetical protein